MKNPNLILVAVFGLISLTLDAQHHEQNQSSETKAVITYETPTAFQDQLQNVYRASIDMKNAFVETDPSKAKETAEQVKMSLVKVDMKILTGEAHMVWMNNLKTLNALLQKIIMAKDIKEQREIFASFNETLYKSIKAFGINGETAFYQFCPMANENKGAFWLSELKEIQNPYLGKKMISCGNTVDSLDSN